MFLVKSQLLTDKDRSDKSDIYTTWLSCTQLINWEINYICIQVSSSILIIYQIKKEMEMVYFNDALNTFFYSYMASNIS